MKNNCLNMKPIIARMSLEMWVFEIFPRISKEEYPILVQVCRDFYDVLMNTIKNFEESPSLMEETCKEGDLLSFIHNRNSLNFVNTINMIRLINVSEQYKHHKLSMFLEKYTSNKFYFNLQQCIINNYIYATKYFYNMNTKSMKYSDYTTIILWACSNRYDDIQLVVWAIDELVKNGHNFDIYEYCIHRGCLYGNQSIVNYFKNRVDVFQQQNRCHFCKKRILDH